MKHGVRILHLEDNQADAVLLKTTLEGENLSAAITCVKTGGEFEAALENGQFDLIISDYSLPGFDGMSALKIANDLLPEAPFIFVSGTIGEENAIEALKTGATDYVLKDRPARLMPAIRRALSDAEAKKKRCEAELRIREQAELLDRAQDAICLLGLDQTILYWNKSAERLYGWRADEVMGRNCRELLFQGNPKRVAEVVALLARDGNWQGEFEQVTKEGRTITVESRWTLVRSQPGEPRGVLIINTDVTEKKQIQAQLLRTQRVQSIGALAGGIAHDLNNCLMPVLMGMDVIGPEVTSENGRKMLETMQFSVRRGADMVKQILSFARGVDGEHAPVHLPRLIQEMVKLAQDTFPRSVAIDCHIAPDLAAIIGNTTQINQVLLNLCVNARDAMPDGGQLRIEAHNLALSESGAKAKHLTPGLYVLLTVSDTGHGIAGEIMERVFEPFFSTKEQTKGTGLGLSTVMGIVKTHGGKVELSSVVGKGTTFSVYLPAAGSAARTPVAPVAPVELQLPKGNGQTLLLVDDEVAILEVTRHLLESFGYNVMTARNGQEALALYRRHDSEIAVVVTDMMMPIMDGIDTVKALNQIDPSVKIVGMTGLCAEAQVSGMKRPDVDAFLEKPFTTAHLLKTLNQLLTA